MTTDARRRRNLLPWRSAQAFTAFAQRPAAARQTVPARKFAPPLRAQRGARHVVLGPAGRLVEDGQPGSQIDRRDVRLIQPDGRNAVFTSRAAGP